MSDIANPVGASGSWWVDVRGQAYGPYTVAQISRFVAEGRVRPTTLMSDRADGAWIEARKVIGLMNVNRTDAANDAALNAANVFVYADIRSGAMHRFVAALEAMGSLCELSDGLWLARTRFSAGSIRNTLSQTLERGDRFVVIDASRDRFAWFNLGPEVDARVSRVWNGPLRGSDG